MKKCKIKDCPYKKKASGYCSGHYYRLKKYGNPTETPLYERHGKSYSREYCIWVSMRDRCYSNKNKYYYNYGGRGIKVCDRWKNSFENFYKDMGDKPSNKHTLDRIDVNGDYTPENCKWSTWEEQSLNKRTRKDNSLGVTGVYYHKGAKKYTTEFRRKGKTYYIGLFNTVEEAAEARKKAIEDYEKNNQNE